MWCPRSLKSLSAMRGFFVSINPYFCLMDALIKKFNKTGEVPILEIVEAGISIFEFIAAAVKSGIPTRKQLAKLQELQAEQLHKLELRIIELEKKSF